MDAEIQRDYRHGWGEDAAGRAVAAVAGRLSPWTAGGLWRGKGILQTVQSRGPMRAWPEKTN